MLIYNKSSVLTMVASCEWPGQYSIVKKVSYSQIKIVRYQIKLDLIPRSGFFTSFLEIEKNIKFI